LLYKKRLYIGESLRHQVLYFVHVTPFAGHAGYDKTIHKARKYFYRLAMKTDVKRFIRFIKECDVCQRVKAENIFPACLLQPLPIPESPWLSISKDFIECLPLSQGHGVIWVVIDRLTKYAHFLPLKHLYSANKLAQLFMTQLFKLHGMPQTIISDTDSTFTSKF
jgi:hypothetical protein